MSKNINLFVFFKKYTYLCTRKIDINILKFNLCVILNILV